MRMAVPLSSASPTRLLTRPPLRHLTHNYLPAKHAGSVASYYRSCVTHRHEPYTGCVLVRNIYSIQAPPLSQF